MSSENMHRVDDLCAKLAEFSDEERAELQRRLNRQAFLEALSELKAKVQSRMRREGRETQSLEEFLAEMRELRDRVANELYPG